MRRRSGGPFLGVPYMEWKKNGTTSSSGPVVVPQVPNHGGKLDTYVNETPPMVRNSASAAQMEDGICDTFEGGDMHAETLDADG
ncbi:flagellar hook-basal body complex FliE family protein [Anopheles sinensis]|uniref:Flagellar hook-basal body complex FliE family protein n=1 Tax=Anopheles sinensis TaxID=74873 RepID=A0A084VZ07_ANOSI|nr:flagellar hook-basal body complex FliE family protein [Anopheles sinensis]